MDETTFNLLYAKYNRLRLSFSEVCTELHIAKATGVNLRVKGIFPVPVTRDGGAVYGDIRDLAKHLDDVRERANTEHH